MEELEAINKYLGGHRITLRGFRALKKGVDKVVVCEIGSGGGDNLKAIHGYCARQNIPVSFIGIDINPDCVAYARTNCRELDVHWIEKDYRLAALPEQPHIIFSSLFCHHFSQSHLAEQLRWMYEHSKTGFFVNDLHRHRLAYYSIKLLTKLFSRSYLVKNDAPLSVLRGFKRKELEQLMQQYEPKLAQLQWMWAFVGYWFTGPRLVS
jgi:hypothetical protein